MPIQDFPWVLLEGDTYSLRIAHSITFDEIINGRLHFIAEGIYSYSQYGIQELELVAFEDTLNLYYRSAVDEHHLVATVERFDYSAFSVRIVSRDWNARYVQIVAVFDSNYMEDVQMFPAVIGDSTNYGLLVFKQAIEKQLIANRHLRLKHTVGGSSDYTFPVLQQSSVVIKVGNSIVFASTPLLLPGNYCQSIPLKKEDDQSDFGEFSNPELLP